MATPAPSDPTTASPPGSCAAPSRAAQLLQATPDPIWFTDVATSLVFDANPAAATLFGWDLAQRQPNGNEVLTTASRAMLGVEAAGLSAGGTWTGELTLRAAGGSRVPATVAVTTGQDPDGRRWFGVIARDVRRAEELQRQLRHRARHDALTGLANREGLIEVLELLVADRGGAVLHLDLDRFKAVNDALGRRVGDALLVAVARRLAGEAGDDATLARLGADGFVVVLPGAGDDEAGAVGRRLREAVEFPYVVGPHDLQVNVSVGVAVTAPGQLPAERLLEHADTAMFLAKDAGGGVELYDEHAHRRVVEGIARRHELRGALARGEFHLAYQPLVALPGERVTGVEALLRWVHPTLGAVGPDTFVPMLEEDGGIVEVGRWVVWEALGQLAAWDAQRGGACHLGVNVNVSVHQLGPDLVDEVAAALAGTGIAADRLTIEVTESALAQDSARAAEHLEQLRASGVRIALDDFGTGFSSLGTLRDLPIDHLKIDRSFVRAMAATGDTALVAGIATMARALGMRTVAEGVEEPEHVEVLERLGVDAGQGYRWARPLPADEVLPYVLGVGPR